MPNAYFNTTAPGSLTTAGQNYPWSHTITAIPQSRLASNGNRPVKIYQVRMYLSAFESATEGQLTISGNVNGTANFPVSKSSSATLTSYTSINARYTTTPFTPTISVTEKNGNSLRIGNSTGGTITIGTSTNRRIWGQYNYMQVPVTPTISSISASSANQTITVNWSAISDWGDAPDSKEYVVRISKSNAVDSNGNFTSTFTTATVLDSSTSAVIPIADNTSSTTYYAQLYAQNELSTFSGSPKSRPSATQSVVLNPAAAAPTWSDSMSNSGRVGVAISGSATASSTATLTLSTPTNDLSDYGLSVSKSGNTYTLSGTPTRSGTASLTMRATDQFDQSTDLVNNITIAAPSTPSWPDLTFKNGTAGTAYGTDSITASSAASVSATWASLSPGLSISTSDSTVTLSGTPAVSANGTYQISVTATGFYDNATSSAPSKSDTATVFINPLPVPEFTDTTIDTVAAINVPYSSSVSATNTTSYSIIDNPGWLLIDSSGNLSGTPTYEHLTYNLTYAQKTFTIRAQGATEFTDEEFVIDVVHPAKIYKDEIANFAYPSNRFSRYDSTQRIFVPVQRIRRRNAANNNWEDIDLT